MVEEEAYLLANSFWVGREKIPSNERKNKPRSDKWHLIISEPKNGNTYLCCPKTYTQPESFFILTAHIFLLTWAESKSLKESLFFIGGGSRSSVLLYMCKLFTLEMLLPHCSTYHICRCNYSVNYSVGFHTH